MRRFSYESDNAGEREPLGAHNRSNPHSRQNSPAPPTPQTPRHHLSSSSRQQQYAPIPSTSPGPSPRRIPPERDNTQSDRPPQPPPHRHPGTASGIPVSGGEGPRVQNHYPGPGYHQGQFRDPGQVGVTPGADNFSDRAAGGMAGIAFSIAEQNARQSGLDAMAPADPNYPQHAVGPVPFRQPQPPSHPTQYERGYDQGYNQGYPQQHQQYDNRQYGGRAGAGAVAATAGGYDPYPDQEPSLPNIPEAPSQAHYPDHTSPYTTHSNSNPYDENRNFGQPSYRHAADRDSDNSLAPFGAAGMTPGYSTPQPGNSSGGGAPGSRGTLPYGGFNPHDHYTDDPYSRYSTGAQLGQRDLGRFDPATIADDGDDGLVYERARHQGRSSLLSLGRNSNHSHQNIPGTAAGAVAGAGMIGAGPAAGKALSNRLSGLYNSVANQSSRSVGQSSGHSQGNTTAAAAAAVGAGAAAAAASGAGSISGGSHGGGSTIGGPAYGSNGAAGPQAGAAGGMDFNDVAMMAASREKGSSEWLDNQTKSSKRWKWCVWIVVILVVAAGIACGVVFGVVLKKGGGSGSGGSSSGSSGSGGSSTDDGSDLDINSKEIQALLNNPNLHKVFPGIDYTPINSQFPDCLQNPPSQNNFTRDLAVLSQLTNTIRLYGTDCNQTEMLITARDRLKLTDTIQIWMGVWQDNNATTNARQLAQMWDIFNKYGHQPFKGVIVANEILFRKQMTVTQLSSLLQSVRQNVTAMGFPSDFVVATSDLGDNWDSTLASISDAIMANIHPFFAGVTAQTASSWTMSFWQNKVGSFEKSNSKLNIISETGWPTQGGSDGNSVASIDNLNTFMDGFVCQALTNGTQYFWFEAFDEPWKIIYDTPGKAWEDHWGLMTVDRKLKDGVKIPDCGGKTVS